MHLMQIAKSSLDDPVADRTVSVIKPASEKEVANEDWLQKKKRTAKMLA